MSYRFRNKIDSILSDFLFKEQFVFEECLTADNENYIACFYKSAICKLKFYRSARDGEIGFKYGTIFAINSLDDDLHGSMQWYFSQELIPKADSRTINEMLDDVTTSFQSDDEMLLSIRDQLKYEFDTVSRVL